MPNLADGTAGTADLANVAVMFPKLRRPDPDIATEEPSATGRRTLGGRIQKRGWLDGTENTAAPVADNSRCGQEFLGAVARGAEDEVAHLAESEGCVVMMELLSLMVERRCPKKFSVLSIDGELEGTVNQGLQIHGSLSSLHLKSSVDTYPNHEPNW